ncbi:MAG TPA: lamin tail domain-containing protein [Sedimentisphaerales bacterium]|nr:lamin tail domain-containing protein [Sedimentisphaerales bacterium]HNU30501.1 lamin tail domain-containing protein [Sedimentisphaerales bacterium]
MRVSNRFPRAAVVMVVLCLLGGEVCSDAVRRFLPGSHAFMGTPRTGVVFAADGAGASIVINELHTNPDVKTELVEFVELHNFGTADADLSGWSFVEGVLYSFPEGTTLAAGGFLVVAQDPDQLMAKYGADRVPLPAGSVFGPYAGGLDGEGERVVLCDASGAVVDEVDYQLGFPWPTVGDAVPETSPGTGPSLQLMNPRSDNDLGGSWRSAYPTPCEANRVFVENVPPRVRQVNHLPRQPQGGQVVTVTAKITDDQWIPEVTLRYQVVTPGDYIAKTDLRYDAEWTSIKMHDNGLLGDARAGDGIYSVQIPAEAQVHRNLVRYRIAATDVLGATTAAPYADDPQPNFAYFVYDGVPAWRGAVQPGVTTEIEFPAEVMRSLPVYHLLSKKSDVEDCTWLSKCSGNEFRWYGTLVYDGRVYDHIRYRARGGVWRYSMSKSMWKLDFGRGHYFQARDDYGEPYDTTWDKLNFSACIQQGSFGQRGEQGMFEALSFRLFDLAGCPASKTNYVHFRIIDELHEDGTQNAAHAPLTTQGTQYDGDFWGLYMTIEGVDGRFLEEHGLPDGNTFKMDYSNDEQNNQGPTQPSDWSDLNQFLGRYQNADESWWRRNVNLDAYYGYHAIYQAVHHGDITEKNWFLYHHPETDQWWQLPWDLDLTWTTYYGSNDPDDPFRRAGVLTYSSIDIENKNRLREVIDLLFNTDQTNQLIDDYAGVIDDPSGGLSLADADRCMWDYHWALGEGAYPTYIDQEASFKAGQGRFYQEAVDRGYERTFEGMVQVMKDYVAERVIYLAGKAADEAIPDTPQIQPTAPAGFPVNALTFSVSAFSDPQGAGTFGAMKWRIAEVAAGSRAAIQDGGETIIVVPEGGMWKYLKGMEEPSVAPGAWRQLDFDDSSWLSGRTIIGYGSDEPAATNLADMRYNYTSVYLRRTFHVADLDALGRLTLDVKFDDGVNLWINGVLAFQDNVRGENVPYSDTAVSAIDNSNFVTHDLGDSRTWLVQGDNVIAIQVLNSHISSSSDCYINARLLAESVQTGASVTVQGAPGKYEIDAAWESGEIKAFGSGIWLPATAARPGRTYRVRCRMKDDTGRWSHWSNPVQFVAGEPVAAGILADLRITELMYNPPELGDGADNDEFEFIEIKNIGDKTLDLSGVSFNGGVTFRFAESDDTSLGPGRFVLVVANEQAFLSRYGTALSGLIAGKYAGRLANEGERVSLVDRWNGTIAEFEYGDGRGWPPAADGGGHSLVPLDSALPGEPDGSLNWPGNWRVSTYVGGSPGRDDPEPETTVRINEFLANPVTGRDWIELYNPTTGAVTLADWYLSDDVADLRKWAVPETLVPAGGYAVFDDIRAFGLSQDGEELFLSYLPGTTADRVADTVRFKAQEPNVALGRYPDGGDYWFRLAPSPGTANANPISDLVISELMYHPPDANEEYIELYNPLSESISFGGGNVVWRLDGGVEYDFPAGTEIDPGEHLIVVGFDPLVDASRAAAFTELYVDPSFRAGIRLLGPWKGNLSNGGERVALEKSMPGDNPASPVAWVIVDEVIYSDATPWPVEADGQGLSLHRIESGAGKSGNDPTNWQAAEPTPGQ